MTRPIDQIETVIRDTLATAAPGISETMRAAIVRTIMLKVQPVLYRPHNEAELEQAERLVIEKARHWRRHRRSVDEAEAAERLEAALQQLDQHRLAPAESRKNSRTADEAFAKYLRKLDEPYSG